MNISQITNYLDANTDFDFTLEEGSDLKLTQKSDGKSLLINKINIDEVLTREDSKGDAFLQLNFIDGTKLLITKTLIGFKPCMDPEIQDRLPRVVTTPDLVSVIELMTDHYEQGDFSQYDTLKRVYISILEGGEAIGFDLSTERMWLAQIYNFDGSAA